MLFNSIPFDKFIPDRRSGHMSSCSNTPQHPFRVALVNIAFGSLAVFALVGSASCALHIVFFSR